MWHHLSSLLRQQARRQRAPEIEPKPPNEATEHLQDAASQSTHGKPSTTLTKDEAHRAALNQLIEDWLNAPLAREQRQLLLEHDDLLAPEAESVLLETIEQYRDRQLPDMMQELHERLRLLAEVRRAGGDAYAITNVYVNLEGGLALDVPPWLDDLERQLTHLPHTEGLHPSAPQRVDLLRQALTRLRREGGIPDEVVAELSVRLWDALDDLVNSTLEEKEEGLACLRDALRVYTLDRYPAQYARCQLCTGNTYQERIAGTRRENFEAALVCYREALRVYRPESFPDLYAMAENNLGNTYRNRIAGSRRDNAEEAIACYQRALEIYTLADYPDGYAMTQNNLGNTYLIRVARQRGDNLEAAILCYREALRVYTQDEAPRDYAMLQVGLGTVYRERLEGSEAENLEAAIQYYEAALQIHSPQNDPLRYAQVQLNLGGAYHERLRGDREENLEVSLACYARALEFYTREAHPTEYALTQMGIGNTLRDRVAGERQANLDHATQAYEAALEVFTPEEYPLNHRNVACALAATLWREVAHEAEQREQWEGAQQAYRHAHALYVSARHIQAELGWIESDEQGRIRLRGSTGGAREMYARDAWCLWRLGNVREALVALEAGRAQSLAEAYSVADATTDHLCEEHASAFVAARVEYAEARLIEDRKALRQARDHLREVREAIRAHCDPELLPNESTMTAIEQAAAPDQALVYLAATDRGGLIGVVLPESSRARISGNEPHMIALPELTSRVVDDWLLLSDTQGLILGGLQVALNREGRRVLRTWAEQPGDDRKENARGRLALPLETVIAQLPASLATVRQTLEHVLAICHAEAERWSLGGQAPHARSWQARAKITLGAALREGWFTRMFDWAFQSAELVNTLPALSQAVIGPLCELLGRLDLGQTTQQVALIPCGRLGALPLHAASAPAAEPGEEVPFQDRCILTYQASARVLRAARSAVEQLPTRGPVIMVGDPRPTVLPVLRWAQAEARAIVRLAQEAQREGSQALVATDASRDQVMAMLEQIRTTGRGAWVGIASHGHADPTDPHKCFMLLAAHGRLTVADMQRQQLLDGVRLFNASGCVTALGDLETAPDELSSFAAGALQAGAAGVFATQWSVSDRATALLMLRFAYEWVGNSEISPAAALRTAAAWLRRATRADIASFAQDTLDAHEDNARSAQAMGRTTYENTVTTIRGVAAQDLIEGAADALSRDTGEMPQRELSMLAGGSDVSEGVPGDAPYAHPIYWASVVAYGV